MKPETEKKGLLGSGIALLIPAITLIVNASYIEGAILGAVAIALIIAYDHLDDRLKGTPALPEGIDEEDLEEFATVTAEHVESQIDDKR